MSDKLDVQWVDIDSITPYENNPRHNAEAIEKVAASIREFGWQQPIVVDEHNVVVVGHTRLAAAYTLGETSVPVHVATELTPEQIKAYRLADNKTNEFAEWDMSKLEVELNGITDDIDMSEFGFTDDYIDMGHADKDVIESGGLVGSFAFVPFSVIQSASGDWQSRKAQWASLGLRSEVGRASGLAYAPGLFAK